MNNNRERKSMIKVRGGYSDRNGYDTVCNIIQVDDFDDRTRVILSNSLFKICDSIFDLSKSLGYDPNYQNRQMFLKEILSEVFNETNFLKDYVSWKEVFNKIDLVFKNAYVHEILDLIEFICDYIKIIYNDYDSKKINSIYECFNIIFERECIGYRFVNGEIIKNIDDTEISTITEASTTEFDGSNEHIKNATHFLYDRTKPDYNNSIKESISAVESISCVIAKKEHASLGDALKILEKKHNLNGQLKSAFEKLYSYTNDENGIRHSNYLFGNETTFEEAKFMLVSCCAFVNYLIAEYGKIGD